MRFCALGSGSKGNCYYIDNDDDALLIDAGFNRKETLKRLNDVGLDISKIRAILVTHEHTDHVKGLASLSTKDNIKVYAPHDCYLACINKLGNINYAGANKNYENGFSINNFQIKPFRTPHDSVYSVGYKITFDGKSIAIATDLGVVTNGVMKNLLGVDMAVVESNHDIEMLKNGKYPILLKKRILSNQGHLSNEACSRLIVELIKGGTKRFALAHLSEENNLVALAYNEADEMIHSADLASGVELSVLEQNAPSDIFII